MVSGFRARLSALVDVEVAVSTAQAVLTLVDMAADLALAVGVVVTVRPTAETVETELLDC